MEKKYYVVVIGEVKVVAFESMNNAKEYVKVWGKAVTERFSKPASHLKIVEMAVPKIPVVMDYSFCSFIDYSLIHEDYEAPDEDFYVVDESIDTEDTIDEIPEKKHSVLSSYYPEREKVSEAPDSPLFAQLWDETCTREQNMNVIADLFKALF